jgi:hypothetical protein
MGWLYGWNTRKELIDHLTAPFETKLENGQVERTETVKRNTKLKHMWLLLQKSVDGQPTKKVIVCILMGYGKRDGHGYKDESECMGPIKKDCPLEFLEAAEPDDSYGWRDKVYAYHKARKDMYAIDPKVGEMWDLRDNFTVKQLLLIEKRGRSFYGLDNQDRRWKVTKRHLKQPTPTA